MLANGTRVVARAALCATGVDYHRLPLPDENRFRGAGVYYGAGAREGVLCAGNPVVIVGGGNPAAQAALFFSLYTPKVVLAIRGDCLNEIVPEYLARRIHSARRVELLKRTEVTSLDGDERLDAIVVTNSDSGSRGASRRTGSSSASGARRGLSGPRRLASSATRAGIP